MLQESEGDILPDVHAIEERAALEDDSDRGSERVAFVAVERVSVDEDFAAIGGEQSEDAFNQHRFSFARSSDDGHGFAAFDIEIDICEHLFFFKGLVEPAHRDFCRRFCRADGGGEGIFAQFLPERRHGVRWREGILSREEEFGEKVVENEDSNRRADDGVRGCASDALRAAGGVEAVVAAQERDERSEDEGFTDAGEEACEVEGFARVL